MYIYIIFLIVLLSIYKYNNKIRSIHSAYKTYKKIIDPTNKYGHIYTMKNIFNLAYSVYDMFQTKQTPPLQKFNKNYLKISYKYNDKDYFYLLKVPRGVIPIISITDENDDNIEDIISPYLGPNLDCHGASIYPRDFGYSKIKIKTVFNKLVIFDENQKIDITY